MSNSAKSNISVYFKDNVEIPLGLTSATALEQSMIKFYYDINGDNLTTPCITVSDFELSDGEIELELYSTRRINLDFQVELLQDMLNEKHSDVIDEITEDTWIQA